MRPHGRCVLREGDRPIGVFDSGVGGLTVLKALRELLPSEDFLYLGDTARLPYGNKSPATIARYAFECALFLMRRGIKMLVVACNSATSHSVPELSRFLRIPVEGVIQPGARAALAVSQGRRIAVIGTQATVRSHAYREALVALDPAREVVEIACPLFVPLAEEGWLDGEVCSAVAETYLAPLREEGVDVCILGCTHYPLLRETIELVLGDGIATVDSASATAESVRARLAGEGLLREGGEGSLRVFLTDVQPHFRSIGERCLGRSIETVDVVRPEE